MSETVFCSNPKFSNSMDFSITKAGELISGLQEFSWEKNVKMSFLTRASSFGCVTVTKTVPISFMKAGQLFKLANRNSLHFDSSLISVRFVEKLVLFLIITLIVVLVSFFSRIYMFDSRSWLSTVVRENVSREKR